MNLKTLINTLDKLSTIDILGINPRMGKIKEVDKFDGSFFGILNQMEDKVDPQSRILLETTYEAIVDAGIQQVITYSVI